jgi:DNA topoisomerase-1
VEGEFPRDLGYDPDTGEVVSLRKGPYGLYVQRGEAEKGKKPKRTSLLKGMDPNTLDLQTALRLLSLPRDLGHHPESGAKIQAGLGRYGPYLKHGDRFISLPADDDVLTIGINRAVAVIAEAGEKGKAGAAKELGAHPSDGKPIQLGSGRFGPYVKHGKIYASIPKSVEPGDVTLEQAIELIDAKAAKKGAGKKGGAKKAAAKKTSAKKAGAKKAGAKKSKAKKASAKKAAGRKAG